MSDILKFDPNNPGVNNGCYFGLPFTPEESALVILPVNWDVTTSYIDGTSAAPAAILDASLQVDLYNAQFPDVWERGIGTLDYDIDITEKGAKLRDDARKIISHLESGGALKEDYVQRKLRRVNEGSEALNSSVYEESKRWIDQGKKVCVLGGDHSTPLGLIKAVAEKYPSVGILHIDAHCDLREAYEGFKYSHASIMYNALSEVGIESLVQVGIRDFCDTEAELIATDSRITLFDDYSLRCEIFNGVTWHALCQKIVYALPSKVYVSFDIDGLTPDNCPHTGTPVPGGLSFNEAIYLVSQVVESGREIVGFDLTEVGYCEDDEWDANVGARVLYKLCNLTLSSK